MPPTSSAGRCRAEIELAITTPSSVLSAKGVQFVGRLPPEYRAGSSTLEASVLIENHSNAFVATTRHHAKPRRCHLGRVIFGFTVTRESIASRVARDCLDRGHVDDAFKRVVGCYVATLVSG
jgi:hypothetical protein